jgi:hypothetical protein
MGLVQVARSRTLVRVRLDAWLGIHSQELTADDSLPAKLDLRNLPQHRFELWEKASASPIGPEEEQSP